MGNKAHISNSGGNKEEIHSIPNYMAISLIPDRDKDILKGN